MSTATQSCAGPVVTADAYETPTELVVEVALDTLDDTTRVVDAHVRDDGVIELRLPLQPGARSRHSHLDRTWLHPDATPC